MPTLNIVTFWQNREAARPAATASAANAGSGLPDAASIYARRATAADRRSWGT